ncbi:AMP-binding protein [Mycobacterium vicinigordonae]|uniref:AMP-binding protein n=1 Tax=Mycobacterium vicinigordonae TaxID=1719132 RepID=A0A7D6E477_9MYCO|nr:AMP-binding protein [Mycobacterium vicinigordonae]
MPEEFPRISSRARRLYGRQEIWPDRLLDNWLAEAAERSPQRAAVVDGDVRLSYRELIERVDRAAAGLRRLRVGHGEVVSFQLPNWWEALVLHFAIIRIGAISNPLIPILRDRELQFMLGAARTKVLVVPGTFRGYDHAGLAQRVRNHLPALERVVTVRGRRRPDATTFTELLIKDDGIEPEQFRRPDDAVLLLYTSGTESEPKGVVHSHNTLSYDNVSIIEHFELHSSDVVFVPSPIAHITGVLYGLHLASMLGSTVVYQDVWEPTRALELVQAERCSFVVAATPFLHGLTYHERLSEYDVSSLRVFACGGADVSPDLIRAANERLDCYALRVYGSTEVPTLTAGACTDPIDKRANTDGRRVGIAEVAILDEDGNRCAHGEVGQLFARGPEAFLGYYGRSGAISFTADGWFDTGDTARIDNDGYVQIAGRTKDIILRGGENLSSKEIEDLLVGYPDVLDVAVVAMPDPILGERACAVVVPRAGAILRLADLTNYLDRLGTAKQKWPERLELVDELPKTPTGKVQKLRLREHVAARLAEDQQPIS